MDRVTHRMATLPMVKGRLTITNLEDRNLGVVRDRDVDVDLEEQRRILTGQASKEWKETMQRLGWNPSNNRTNHEEKVDGIEAVVIVDGTDREDSVLVAVATSVAVDGTTIIDKSTVDKMMPSSVHVIMTM